MNELSHSRGDILKVGICRKCHVIYKLRTTDNPPDGIYRCRECGAAIELGGKAPLRFSGAGN